MSNIRIVIEREFTERVRKKSFIITTILMPILMLALTVAPILIMEFAGADHKTITVVDESGLIFGGLTNNEEVSFSLSTESVELARTSQDSDVFGVLHIGADILQNPSQITLYTSSASSIMLESSIASNVESIIEEQRLKAYNIDNLDQILQAVKADVHITSIRSDRDEDKQSHSSMAAMGVGYVLGFMLYMFLLLYGAMVMSSVIEEKSSRVLEVLVSSVKPFDLLLGKIVSIAMVALTQIAIWGVLLIAISAFVLPALMPADVMSSAMAMQSGGVMVSDMGSVDPQMVEALATLTDVGYIVGIISYMILFLIGGYLLYSAMFAAVGSAVDTAEDAQNLQLPIMMPIILSMLLLMMVAQDPNSLLIRIASIFPFTSPIIMMARIPHGIATWEIILSLVLLYASFVGMVWCAAKIYRVGIFMHGKKPSLKELYKWMRYKS